MECMSVKMCDTLVFISGNQMKTVMTHFLIKMEAHWQSEF